MRGEGPANKIEPSSTSVWLGDEPPLEASDCALCRVDGSKNTLHSPGRVKQETVGCQVCSPARYESRQTGQMASPLAVDAAAQGLSLHETKSGHSTPTEKAETQLKHALAKLVPRSRKTREENVYHRATYAGSNVKVRLEELAIGSPSDIPDIQTGLNPYKTTASITNTPPSRHLSNDISLLTEISDISSVNTHTGVPATRSDFGKEGFIVAPEGRDESKGALVVGPEKFATTRLKMPVVLTGLFGPSRTARRRRAGSFDSIVSESSRINASLTESEANTPSPPQSSSIPREHSSQNMRQSGTKRSIRSTNDPNIKAVTGSRPPTALEILTRPFPTELFESVLNGRGRSSRKSSIFASSTHPSRCQRARDKALSSGGKSELEPNLESGPKAGGGDDRDNKVNQPATITPSRFPSLPRAVTRDILAHYTEDSPTSFLNHVDELEVIRQRRSAITQASSTPSYHHLRRTEKSSGLGEHTKPVCKKAVRFFLGHLSTGTVPSISISSVPDEETHVLPPTSETDRSLLSVNKKLHGAKLSQRNAERKAERLRIVQTRAGRIYNMTLGSNGGDKEKAKVKAEEWLNCQETRMFVAGWIKDDECSIPTSGGAWRDINESQEYVR